MGAPNSQSGIALLETSRRHGGAALSESDKVLGVSITGNAGMGKSSVMTRSVGDDARRTEKAMILLDPKGDLALKALSVTPPGRTVWYLDLALPEFGLNLMNQPGSIEFRAQLVVSALRDVYSEMAIQQSSAQYLVNAAVGAMLVAESERRVPSFWDLYTLLGVDTHPIHAKVIEEANRRGFPFCHDFYSRQLPADVQANRGATSERMAAPRNKIATMLQQNSIERYLHHPIQLDIPGIVERREILVVNGSLGSVGEENAVFMLQFLLRMLAISLQAQQGRSREERVPVALKIDEAHYFMTLVLAQMLETGRSAKLEPMLAYQHEGQVDDERVQSAMGALLQNRIVHRMGNQEEARTALAIMQDSYSPRVGGDAEDRQEVRFTDDDALHLDKFYTLNSWVVDGNRTPGFVGMTLPAEEHERLIRYHVCRQRERGAFYPEWFGSPHDKQSAFEHEKAPEIDYGSASSDTARHEAVTELGVPNVAVNGGIARRAAAEGEDAVTHEGTAPSAEAVTPGESVPRTHPKSPADDGADVGLGHDAAEGPVETAPDAVADDGAPGAASYTPSNASPTPRPPSAPEEQGPALDRDAPGSLAGTTAPESFLELQLDSPGGLEHDAPVHVRPIIPVEQSALATAIRQAKIKDVAVLVSRGEEMRTGVEAARRQGLEPTLPDRTGEAPPTAEDKLDDVLTTAFAREELTREELAELGAKVIERRAPYPVLDERGRAILSYVHKGRFLSTGQLHRHFWPDRKADTVYRNLGKMYENGLLARFRIRTGRRGSQQYIYMLTERGFRTAQAAPHGPHGAWIPETLTYSKQEPTSAAHVLHDLRVTAWVLAVEQAFGSHVKRWFGPREPIAQMKAPEIRDPRTRERRPAMLTDIAQGMGRAIGGVQLERFESINADAVIRFRDFNAFVEIDSSDRPSKGYKKFLAYDAFLTAWVRTISYYEAPSPLPRVVFVCRDRHQVDAFMKVADQHVTGAVSNVGDPPEQREYPGRENMYFVAEVDAHQGTLRALKVPKHPLEVRKAIGEEIFPDWRQTALIAGPRESDR